MGMKLELYSDDTFYIKYNGDHTVEKSLYKDTIEVAKRMSEPDIDVCNYNGEFYKVAKLKGCKYPTLGDRVGDEINDVLYDTCVSLREAITESGGGDYGVWREDIATRWNNIVDAGFDIVERKQLLQLGLAEQISVDQTALFFHHNEVYLEEEGIVDIEECKEEFKDRILKLAYSVMNNPIKQHVLTIPKYGRKIKSIVNTSINYTYFTIFLAMGVWNRLMYEKHFILEGQGSVAS